MTKQDSQSELDKILNKVYADGEYYATHSENVILDGHTRRSIKNAKQAIEAYVTTRVKEAEELLRAEVNFYKDRCKMERNKYDILAKSTQEKVKEAERLARIEMVGSANCILEADEPAIDEIWFDYEGVPMRQDTLFSHLQALTTTTNGKEE